MYIAAIIGIIGRNIVEIEMLVLKHFLNKKLDISSIGHNTINANSRFSIVNIFLIFCSFLFNVFIKNITLNKEK